MYLSPGSGSGFPRIALPPKRNHRFLRNCCFYRAGNHGPRPLAPPPLDSRSGGKIDAPIRTRASNPSKSMLPFEREHRFHICRVWERFNDAKVALGALWGLSEVLLRSSSARFASQERFGCVLDSILTLWTPKSMLPCMRELRFHKISVSAIYLQFDYKITSQNAFQDTPESLKTPPKRFKRAPRRS